MKLSSMFNSSMESLKVESSLKLENIFQKQKNSDEDWISSCIKGIDENKDLKLLCEKAVIASESLAKELEVVRKENDKLRLKNLELANQLSA